jgi:TRAP-type C4-dicarboxylate transport system permease small subunit
MQETDPLLRRPAREYEDVLGVLVLAAASVVVLVSVFFRYVLNDSLVWAEEFARFSLVAITFLGTGIGFRKDSHIRVDLVDRLPGPAAAGIRFFVSVVSLALTAWLAFQAVMIMPILANSTSAAMEMPMSWLYGVVAAGLAGGCLRLALSLLPDAGDGARR